MLLLWFWELTFCSKYWIFSINWCVPFEEDQLPEYELLEPSPSSLHWWDQRGDDWWAVVWSKGLPISRGFRLEFTGGLCWRHPRCFCSRVSWRFWLIVPDSAFPACFISGCCQFAEGAGCTFSPSSSVLPQGGHLFIWAPCQLSSPWCLWTLRGVVSVRFCLSPWSRTPSFPSGSQSKGS